MRAEYCARCGEDHRGYGCFCQGTGKVSVSLPDVPPHPESQIMVWSDLETGVIVHYGVECFQAGLATKTDVSNANESEVRTRLREYSYAIDAFHEGGKLKPLADVVNACWTRLEAVLEKPQWKCFHCNEVFDDKRLAEDHFGPQWWSPPLCQIDGKKFREMEAKVERLVRESQEEATDLHRQVGRMESEHRAALKREEETGYARGLRDSVPTGMVYAVAVKTQRRVAMLFDTNEQANAFVEELSKYPGYSPSLPPDGRQTTVEKTD